MKKLYTLVTALTLVSHIGNAQNFSFTEGNLIEKDIILEEFETAESKILNESDESVTFEWEMITFDNPFGWEFSLCDYASCYTSGETSGTMTAVDGGSESAFFKVNVYASNAGVGTYSIVCWDQALPDDKDTITFILTASEGSSGIEEANAANISARYMNQTIQFDNNSAETVNYTVYSISGQALTNGVLAPHSISQLDRGDYLPGLYFIAFEKNGAIIETEKLVLR